MNSKTYSFYLPRDVIKMIERIAKKLGTSHSQAVSLAIRAGAQNVRTRKASGV